MKFKVKSLGQYVVLLNGSEIGSVWKTFKHGYVYWKNSADGSVLFNTRQGAAESLKGAMVK